MIRQFCKTFISLLAFCSCLPAVSLGQEVGLPPPAAQLVPENFVMTVPVPTIAPKVESTPTSAYHQRNFLAYPTGMGSLSGLLGEAPKNGSYQGSPVVETQPKEEIGFQQIKPTAEQEKASNTGKNPTIPENSVQQPPPNEEPRRSEELFFEKMKGQQEVLQGKPQHHPGEVPVATTTTTSTHEPSTVPTTTTPTTPTTSTTTTMRTTTTTTTLATTIPSTSESTSATPTTITAEENTPSTEASASEAEVVEGRLESDDDNDGVEEYTTIATATWEPVTEEVRHSEKPSKYKYFVFATLFGLFSNSLGKNDGAVSEFYKNLPQVLEVIVEPVRELAEALGSITDDARGPRFWAIARRVDRLLETDSLSPPSADSEQFKSFLDQMLAELLHHSTDLFHRMTPEEAEKAIKVARMALLRVLSFKAALDGLNRNRGDALLTAFILQLDDEEPQSARNYNDDYGGESQYDANDDRLIRRFRGEIEEPQQQPSEQLPTIRAAAFTFVTGVLSFAFMPNRDEIPAGGDLSALGVVEDDEGRDFADAYLQLLDALETLTKTRHYKNLDAILKSVWRRPQGLSGRHFWALVRASDEYITPLLSGPEGRALRAQIKKFAERVIGEDANVPRGYFENLINMSMKMMVEGRLLFCFINNICDRA